MDRLPDIYDEGAKAYLAGRMLNPYKRDTPEANAWDLGWQEAESHEEQGFNHG